MHDRRWDVYRRGVDFIQKYIFPGGMLPARRVAVAEIERAGLRVAALRRVRRELQPDAAALARDLQRPLGRDRAAGLRRAVPADVELLPHLLRGGLRLGQLRRDADHRRAAGVTCRPRARPWGRCCCAPGLRRRQHGRRGPAHRRAARAGRLVAAAVGGLCGWRIGRRAVPAGPVGGGGARHDSRGAGGVLDAVPRGVVARCCAGRSAGSTTTPSAALGDMMQLWRRLRARAGRSPRRWRLLVARAGCVAGIVAGAAARRLP